MAKIAFVFPGQGSQAVGMGKSFYDDEFTSSKEAFDEADEVLGFSIKKLCFDGPADELNKTENTQPGLLVASIAALRALESRIELKPAFLAGHSLGEYTALVAAGSLKFRDAVKLVHLRGKFMQESVPQGTGKMAAIIGLGIDAVAQVCIESSDANSIAVPANLNSPEQIVISGHAAAVDKASVLAKEKGAKMAVSLQVSAPSHSPLMESAAQRLKAELEKTQFANFSIPVITNVEAMPAPSVAAIRGLLEKQLTSPVRWVGIVKKMKEEGVTHILEIGPGKVLTGLVKRIDKEINLLNLAEKADIDKVSAALQNAL